jgi:hypothetical protein
MSDVGVFGFRLSRSSNWQAHHSARPIRFRSVDGPARVRDLKPMFGAAAKVAIINFFRKHSILVPTIFGFVFPVYPLHIILF